MLTASMSIISGSRELRETCIECLMWYADNMKWNYLLYMSLFILDVKADKKHKTLINYSDQ